MLICDKVDKAKLSLDDAITVDYRPEISRQELLRTVGAYDALIIRSRTKVDKEVIDKGTRLKLIARPGTGLDNVDVTYAESKGIRVVNSPEPLVEAVAEHVMLLMLGLSRMIVLADQTTKEGKWEKNSLKGRELKGKVLGIVGLGRIGRRVGEIARAAGMSILVYDVVPLPPDVIAGLGARVVSLDELLASADYVTLHVPLTDETEHMIDAKRLAAMRKGAYLINASRGGVVDEKALAASLGARHLGGAGLDVFETEPPGGEILRAPNTILTPHIGGQTEEAQEGAIEAIGIKVREFFAKS